MGVYADLWIRTPARVSDAELTRLQYDIVDTFGPDRLHAHRDVDDSFLGHAVDRMDVAPGDVPNNEGHWLSTSLTRTLYDVGYERGDLWLFVAVAVWFEHQIPGAELWYGGPPFSRMRRFDAAERERLTTHFSRVGHQPYAGARNTPLCCGRPMIPSVCYNNRQPLHCPLCGKWGYADEYPAKTP